MESVNNDNKKTRREFLRDALRGASLAALGGLVGLGLSRGRGDTYVWQIDPAKCNSCGLCATACVLEETAVKCMHNFDICGYDSTSGNEVCNNFFFESNEGYEDIIVNLTFNDKEYKQVPKIGKILITINRTTICGDGRCCGSEDDNNCPEDCDVDDEFCTKWTG